MAKRIKIPLKRGKNPPHSVPPFPFEFRLKVSRLFIEDGYPAKLIATQFGISDYSLYRNLMSEMVVLNVRRLT
jgi:transposase-like protein